MKRLMLMALLTLALPLAAFANTVDLTNINGTLTGTVTGLSLAGSEVISVTGLGNGMTGDLATVKTFSTGALLGGSLAAGGTFAGGGTFTIRSTREGGADGLPRKLFTGSFVGTVSWTKEGNGIYQLSGHVSGTLDGKLVKGFTSQLYFGTVTNGTFSGTLGSGDTILSTPEPGTLGLLGIGLVGLAGLVRKKLKA